MNEESEFYHTEKHKKCPFCGEDILVHIIKEGARYHVLHWDTQGRHCSEPNCELNHICKSGVQNEETEKQKELIKQAKQHITELPPDYHLANYILRDSPIVKKTKSLSDLSWAMHQDRNVSKSDVLLLIELIEKEMLKKS